MQIYSLKVPHEEYGNHVCPQVMKPQYNEMDISHSSSTRPVYVCDPDTSSLCLQMSWHWKAISRHSEDDKMSFSKCLLSNDILQNSWGDVKSPVTSGYHIVAEEKWLPSCRIIFSNFLEWKIDSDSGANFRAKKSASVQIIARRLTVNKPLSKWYIVDWCT